MGDIAEMYDYMLDDDADDALAVDEPQQLKACRYCGKSGMLWFQFDEGWRLVETGNLNHSPLQPHVCDRYRNGS